MYWRALIIALLSFSLSFTESKSVIPPKKVNTKMGNIKSVAKVELPSSAKLLIGAGGIYGAFLYYGTLQESVFHYKANDGSMFTSAWFLQAIGNFYFLFIATESFF